MWDVLNDGKGSEEQTEEREEMAVEEWWDAVEQVMSEEPFFGCIDNAGLKVRSCVVVLLLDSALTLSSRLAGRRRSPPAARLLLRARRRVRPFLAFIRTAH